MKTCTKCNETHPLEAFHRSTAHKDGRRNICRACRAEHKRNYHARVRPPRPKGAIPRNIYRRWSKIRAKYGITEAAYLDMLEKQGGCAICGVSESDRSFAVDHCHRTGRIRGLLCGPCNTGIGMLKDDPRVVLKAALYLDPSIEIENRGGPDHNPVAEAGPTAPLRMWP